MKKMKKLLLIIICLPFIGFGQPSNVYIPDANFKAYLVGNTAINTNGDNEIQVSEATPFVGSINCSNLGIFDLTGIEAFTALTNLNCEQNQLAILDVSTNTDLTSLICNTNQLTILDVSANISLTVLGCVSNQLNSLDVSTNTNLNSLYCSANQLTSLDLSNNTALTELISNANQLTSLDISANTALTQLYCNANQLTSLDVSTNTDLTFLDCQVNQLTSLIVITNTALTQLYCHNNQLTSLNVSANTALWDLGCNDNQLTSLDVSANTNLIQLWCKGNQLINLDVSANTALTNLNCEQNQLTSLDVRNGNNTAFTNFTTTNNPNLFCIDVDDNGYSAANWTNIDATHYFSTNCSPTNSIYDLITNSALTILQTAIDTCGGAAALQGPGPFTLFAPTDAAFNALGQANLLQLLGDIPTLTNILTHHLVGDSVMSGMLSNGQLVTTLLGNDVTITINSNGDVFIDNAQVIVADIVADNGVIHVIDAVLIPPTPANNTVYDIIDLSPSHNTLRWAIDTCGLDGTLQGPGPFTVFAPTDAAFNALPTGTVTALLNDLPQLTDILKHHVVGDSVMSGMLSNGQVVTTLLGNDVTVTINSNGDVFIDNAQVIIVDIVADNGVVHVIDAVLLPITTLVSEINELNNKYLHSVNILGKKISRDAKNQIILDIYSNGNIIKRYTK